MKLKAMIPVLLVLAATSAAPGKTEWAPVSQGRLEIKNAHLQAPKKDVPSVAPLRHTDVKIKVRGSVAQVTVTQEFHNPLDEPIEAVYVFPLPHDAAVNATEMRIGKRVIRGKIDRRDAARRRYDQARSEGKRASLLEQERANIFTQSLANIGPGETIQVVIRYVQTLPYRDGRYELVFPMVVGPRYIPGRPLTGENGRALRSGTGRRPDTDQVPDASRITPPVYKPPQRCGHDIAVTVDIHGAVPIAGLDSRAHRVVTTRSSKSKATVKLAEDDRIPNKDFVLHVAVASDQPEIGLLAHHNGKGGYFTLVLQPPKSPKADQVRPREIICVLDCSGSMHGKPISLSKRSVLQLLSSLRPGDRFNVIGFSNRAIRFRPQAVPASAANVSAGKGWVRRLGAGGGTEMLSGVRAALATPAPEECLRIVVFLTDGYIGNEWAVVGELQKLLRGARLFSFGIGSSVNRMLIDRMALAGRGMGHYVLLGDDPEKVIDKFIERIDKPVLTDISVKITGAKTHSLIPADVPDIFAGAPIYLHGRYDKPGEVEVEVLGRIGTRPSRAVFRTTLPGPDAKSSPLPSVWARQKIKHLELDRLVTNDSDAIEKQITELALEYSLMSRYTSFVAIDETPTPFGRKAKRIVVKVPMPEGVSYETTIVNPNLGSGPRLRSGGGFSLSLGGGPVGLIGIVIVAVLAAAELKRRRKDAPCG